MIARSGQQFAFRSQLISRNVLHISKLPISRMTLHAPNTFYVISITPEVSTDVACSTVSIDWYLEVLLQLLVSAGEFITCEISGLYVDECAG